MSRRAPTSKLAPGETTIDRNTPWLKNGRYCLTWTIALQDGRTLRKTSQAATKGEVRRRAKAKATEILASGVGSVWKNNDKLSKYLVEVSRPAIDSAPLRDSSKSRYRLAVRLLMGECSAEHVHAHSLRTHTIGSGVRFRVLENCLKEIARLHGEESAHQARSVLSKYVLDELVRDELIPSSPIAGKRIDLARGRAPGSARGGRALNAEDWSKVVGHLLTLDPAEGIEAPKQGRWTFADRVAVKRNAIDLTLFQAATGLRVGEAVALTWNDIDVDDQGQVYVTVSDLVSKTHRGRRAPILDRRVAERILARRGSEVSDEDYIIGSPALPTRRWAQRQRGKAIETLYLEMAQELEIKLLLTARSHVWRSTLNTLLLDSVPEAQRAAFFGHNAATNRGHYTDVTDTSAMISAAQSRLGHVSFIKES